MTARTRATAMTAAAKIAAAVVAAAKTAVVAAAAKTAAAAKATQKTRAPTPKSTEVIPVVPLQRHPRQRWCTAPIAWTTLSRRG